MAPNPAKIVELKQRFTDLDTDGDGTLNFEEFKVLLQKGNAALSERDLRVLFRAVDQDNTGDIIFDEFVDYLCTPPEWFEAARNGDRQTLAKLAEHVNLAAVETQELSGAGQNVLMIASANGHDDCVDELIARKAPVNATGKIHKRTAVMVACEQGNYGCLFSLCDASASLNLQDSSGMTALMFACKDGHDRCVKFLLRRAVIVDLKDCNGWTALLWCAMAGFPDIVSLLLDAAADVNSRTLTGRTAIMNAASVCDERCLRTLIDRYADVETTDYHGMSALDVGRVQRKETCLRILEAHLQGMHAFRLFLGAGMRRTSDENLALQEEWFQAAWSGDAARIEDMVLEEQVAIDAATVEGWTAAMVCTIMGHDKVLKYLIEMKADMQRRDAGGFTPLMLAAKKGNYACLREILATRVDVNVADHDNRTAVILACEDGHDRCIQELVNRKADLSVSTTHQAVGGQSPAMIYLFSVCRILRLREHNNNDNNIKFGSQLSTPTPHSPSRSEKSPEAAGKVGRILFSGKWTGSGDDAAGPTLPEGGAYSRGPSDGANRPRAFSMHVEDDPEVLAEWFRAAYNGHVGKLDGLITKGVCIDARNKRGLTAAMAAAWSGREHCLHFLAARNADLNLRSRSDGYSALVMAACRGEIGCMRVLLDAGAAHDMRCFGGRSALTYSCTQGDSHAAMLLCRARCDLDARDNFGFTASMHAASNCSSVDTRWTCLEILAEEGAEFLIRTPGGSTRNVLHILEHTVGYNTATRFKTFVDWRGPAKEGVGELRKALQSSSAGGATSHEQLMSLHFLLFRADDEERDDEGQRKLVVRDARFSLQMALAVSELLEACKVRTLSDEDKGLLSMILSAGILRAVTQEVREELLQQNQEVLEELEKALDLRQRSLSEIAHFTDKPDVYLQRRNRNDELIQTKLDQRDACPPELWAWVEELADGCFDRLKVVFKAFKDVALVPHVASFSNYCIDNSLTTDDALLARATAHILVGYAQSVDEHFARFMRELFGNRFKRAPVKKLKRIFAKMAGDEPRLEDDAQAAASAELRAAYFDLGDLVRGAIVAQGSRDMIEVITKLRSLGTGKSDYKFEAWRIKNTHHPDSADMTGGYRDVKVLGRFTATYAKTDKGLPISMIVEVQVMDAVFADVKKYMHKAYAIVRGDFD